MMASLHQVMLNPYVTEEPTLKKNDIVEEEGKLWWHVDDVKIYASLMLIDVDYYARSSGQILTNTKYWITKHNDLLPAANYTFGADGKMVR